MLKLRGKELWLVTGSIPVPEYLWKLVVDTVSGDSIVFVTLNNPHLPYLTRSVTLCKDLCQDAGWGNELREREEVGQGFTHFSDTKQFRKKVPWVPEVEGEKILLF